MKILVADDSALARERLTRLLEKWGHETVAAEDGQAALAILEGADPPQIALLDWEMPHLSGPEVCRTIRAEDRRTGLYLILVTAREDMTDLVEGLEAGADDYVTKTFDRDELRARVRVGERVVDLQQRLHRRLVELEQALSKVQVLEGLLPICSYCKKIRDDGEYWHQVESYVQKHTEAEFTHTICPDCFDTHVQPHLED